MGKRKGHKGQPQAEPHGEVAEPIAHAVDAEAEETAPMLAAQSPPPADSAPMTEAAESPAPASAPLEPETAALHTAVPMAEEPKEPKQPAAETSGYGTLQDAPQREVAADTESYSLGKQLNTVFLETWQLKTLLITVPFACVGGALGFSEGVLFFLSFFGLVPLAALLGDFTEDLALRSNDVIGALINVTFGNATELIISIIALRAGMYDVIKLSLIGSVLGNMLLVLGTAFVVGGSRYKILRFSCDAVNTYGPLLVLTMLSFLIPSMYAAMHTTETGRAAAEQDRVTLKISREIAALMCLTYVAYLVFQLHTHRDVFDEDSQAGEEERKEEKEEEKPEFSALFALLGLAVVSVLISWLSDVLVDTLQGAAQQWHIPKQFIGLILVPIVGNAAEHASAIVMAAKNKCDIAVGVALGSSIQIAMFVMPVLVVAGWVINAPLDMNFHPFLVGVTIVSVLVVTQITNNGKSNWLEGLLLFVSYVMIALTFLSGTIDIN